MSAKELIKPILSELITRAIDTIEKQKKNESYQHFEWNLWEMEKVYVHQLLCHNIFFFFFFEF